MEAVAKLRNYPTSPRKMRLLAELVRGMKVEKALAVLEHIHSIRLFLCVNWLCCHQQLEAEE